MPGIHTSYKKSFSERKRM